MLNQLVEVTRAFAHPAMQIKSNIVSPGGTSSSNPRGNSGSIDSGLIGNKLLSTYYRKIQELRDYEITDITKTTVSIYEDFIIGYLNTNAELVSISSDVKNYQEKQDRLNRIMEDLEIQSEVKDNLWDIIYDGAYCFKVVFDNETRKYKKEYLHNPHNVVTVRQGGEIVCHLVTSKNGDIYITKPNSIFRIGQPDLSLINDINENFLSDSKEDSIVRNDQMYAGTPLYYYISNKIKEYLLKEQLLSLLSIKDLIQPLLLLVRLDKNTSPDEGNKIAMNIENMINKHSDLSSMMGSKFNLNQLTNTIVNNIRVLPDYQSAMGDMNEVNLSKVSQKIQEIENTLEMKKENILMANSIPRALFNGETTKWEAIKSSQRLQSKIHNFTKSISESIKSEVIRIHKELTGELLKPDEVTINLFSKTEVDYNNALTNAEIATQLTQGISQIIQSTQQSLMEFKIIDTKAYSKYVLDQLKSIDPAIETFMNEETITKALNEMQQQMAQEGQEQQ